MDWSGEVTVCVASGASAELVDLEAARGRARVIVVNDSWRLCRWADVLYACDASWWMRSPGLSDGPPARSEFPGLRVTQDRAAARALGLQRVHLTRGVDRILTDRKGVIGWGGHGGFHALNIAVQAGARRIALVGYDLGGEHWHGPHGAGLRNPPPSALARWARILDDQASLLADLGVTVLNCSPTSALTAFPKASLAEALDGG